jgi:hypothetical protein
MSTIPAGRPERLQDHLDRLRAGEPVIPLRDGQALAQARRLRTAGLSYTSVAHVMALYHGAVKSPDAWRWNMRRLGMPPKHHSDGPRLAPWQR